MRDARWQKLHETFLREGFGLVAVFGRAVASLSADTGGPALDELVRAPHRLASAAAMLGHADLAALAGLVESAAEDVRQAGGAEPEGTAALRLAHEAIGALLVCAAEGRGGTVDLAEVRAELSAAFGVAAPVRAAQARRTRLGSRTGCVMVVDDSPTVLASVQLVLEEAGLEVRPVNAGGATPVLDGPTPDLVLLDVDLPAARLDDLVIELRRRGAGRILLHSGKSDAELAALTVLHAVDGYLAKTSDPEVLAAEVERWLEAAA